MKLTLAAAAVLALSSPLSAQTLINTPEEIMAVARAYGTATLDTEGRDRPLMTGTMEGTNYGVLMYGCAGNRDCESIQLFATFTTENRDRSSESISPIRRVRAKGVASSAAVRPNRRSSSS